jgi:hypothetical protein
MNLVIAFLLVSALGGDLVDESRCCGATDSLKIAAMRTSHLAGGTMRSDPAFRRGCLYLLSGNKTGEAAEQR